ncbi:uncharacterized protein LOC126411337 [Schistocerca serialis cubense]|uniref:uncharacterized protein LOC126411337 n=1 Tax=Schistocerca serialis cubense TaxID=2023355 RepID=UPI00214EA7BE|nr:uncharacterized protein LOC126411337 [Schistocerca serialis cubense]
MFARLCQHNVAGEAKRRHSWSSDCDFQLVAGATLQPRALSTWYLTATDGVPDVVGPCGSGGGVGSSSSSTDNSSDEEGGDTDDGRDGGGGGSGGNDGDEEEEEEEGGGQEEAGGCGGEAGAGEAQLSAAPPPRPQPQAQPPEDMGQRPSRPRISLTWVLRSGGGGGGGGGRHAAPGAAVAATCPERPPPPGRARSEPSLMQHRQRRQSRASHKPLRSRHSRFGYDIQDVDAFLTKASIEKPANIPVVLASPCVLYQTRTGGYQEELSLPLGMVVNAVFKNQSWLYVQTPHGEEGYVGYGACLPLGILPPPQRSKPQPCWETHADIFPRPLGNRTDSEKLRDGTRSECGAASGSAASAAGAAAGRCYRARDAVSACGERSVDRLYLRAAASAKCRAVGTRHTLLVIRSDYSSRGRNTLSVAKGDVVALVSGHLKDWFWVRSRDGSEGFIPSVVAGHGFL